MESRRARTLGTGLKEEERSNRIKKNHTDRFKRTMSAKPRLDPSFEDDRMSPSSHAERDFYRRLQEPISVHLLGQGPQGQRRLPPGSRMAHGGVLEAHLFLHPPQGV